MRLNAQNLSYDGSMPLKCAKVEVFSISRSTLYACTERSARILAFELKPALTEKKRRLKKSNNLLRFIAKNLTLNASNCCHAQSPCNAIFISKLWHLPALNIQFHT
jgi:hypothetical protein